MCAWCLLPALQHLLAADDFSQLYGQKSDTDATGDGTASPSDSTGQGSASGAAKAPDDTNADLPPIGEGPSPTPAPAADSGASPDQQAPLPSPTPEQEATPEPTPESEAPAVQIEPPLPGEQSIQEAANGVPLPANPALQQQYSEWDLAQVESPMFLNAAIDEFNDRPVMLTGNWSVQPHFSIGSYYNGNIFLSSQHTESDLIARAAPGVTMRLGNDESMFYLMADYTLGLDYYIQHPKESSIDQDARAQFQWSMPKTIIGLTLDVSSERGEDVDVSDLVRRTLYFLGLTSHYSYGEKTSIDVSADYVRSDYSGLIDSSQVEADAFFNYQYSPKTQVGVGGAAGYMVVPGAASQTYEQANLRATYRATGKITLISEAGMELREYGSGQGDSLTPVFLIEGAWVPREGTTVNLDARRSIYASAILHDQNYTATSSDLSVSQRITDYVSVSLAGGFVNTDYQATASNVSAMRQDNYFYIRPAVAWKALSWMSVGIFYEYDQDLSSGDVQANSFTQNQGGLDLAILF